MKGGREKETERKREREREREREEALVAPLAAGPLSLA